MKELFVPHRCLETNWEVSKQIAFASNSFRAKKKKGNALFFFFFKGGAFEMGNMQKTWLAREHEVFKMRWLPARELT